jgi:hypothetical protein
MRTRETLALFALVALAAGCSSGHGTSTLPGSAGGSGSQGAARAPRYNGGPGTTTLTYYDTYAPVGQCTAGQLTLMSYYTPVHDLSFAAGNGPPLVVSNCNFSTPQYVKVTLGTPAYGSPYIKQVDYTVTVDADAAAKVTATWTALGPTLPGTPGTSGMVNYTIGDPDGGGGL